MSNSYGKDSIHLEDQLSALHARLLSTLNALDALKFERTNEVESLQRDNTSLSTRLRLAQMDLEAANGERDALRASLNDMIAKVEHANNLRGVAALGSFRATHLLEPRRRPKAPHVSGIQDVYLPAVLSSLTSDLEVERRAHLETQKEGSIQIAILEAQLARRDAQLQAHILGLQPAETSTMWSSAPTHRERTRGFRSDDIHVLLSEAAERNNSLTVEVGRLEKQLQHEQTTSMRNSHSQPLSPGSITNPHISPSFSVHNQAIHEQHYADDVSYLLSNHDATLDHLSLLQQTNPSSTGPSHPYVDDSVGPFEPSKDASFSAYFPRSQASLDHPSSFLPFGSSSNPVFSRPLASKPGSIASPQHLNIIGATSTLGTTTVSSALPSAASTPRAAPNPPILSTPLQPTPAAVFGSNDRSSLPSIPFTFLPPQSFPSASPSQFATSPAGPSVSRPHLTSTPQHNSHLITSTPNAHNTHPKTVQRKTSHSRLLNVLVRPELSAGMGTIFTQTPERFRDWEWEDSDNTFGQATNVSGVAQASARDMSESDTREGFPSWVERRQPTNSRGHLDDQKGKGKATELVDVGDGDTHRNDEQRTEEDNWVTIERDNLERIASGHRATEPDESAFRQVWLLEEECIRLRREADRARLEAGHAQAALMSRDQTIRNLEERINAQEQAASSIDNTPNADDRASSSSYSTFGDNTGVNEEEIDVFTDLQPNAGRGNLTFGLGEIPSWGRRNTPIPQSSDEGDINDDDESTLSARALPEQSVYQNQNDHHDFEEHADVSSVAISLERRLDDMSPSSYPSYLHPSFTAASIVISPTLVPLPRSLSTSPISPMSLSSVSSRFDSLARAASIEAQLALARAESERNESELARVRAEMQRLRERVT